MHTCKWLGDSVLICPKRQPHSSCAAAPGINSLPVLLLPQQKGLLSLKAALTRAPGPPAIKGVPNNLIIGGINCITGTSDM